ncbi:MAG: M23 family metallopeptidase [Desulfobacterales bacterium]
MRSQGLSVFRLLLILVVLGVLAPAGWFLFTRLEGAPPEVRLEPDPTALGIARDIEVSVADEGSGLRFVRVILSAGGKDETLFEESFGGSALAGSGDRPDTKIQVQIEPRKLGLADGNGILRIEAADYSWRRWWNGNLAEIERPVVIDTTPPQVAVITTSHYINQGGAGLVAFKVSEDCPRLGVVVGDHFYPAHSGFFKAADVYSAFFAVAFNQGSNTPVMISATDAAGNETTAVFNYRIRAKQFRSDNLNISDRFIETHLKGVFQTDGANSSNKDLFLHVNRIIRKTNYDTLTGVGTQSETTKHWDGAFLRLPNSAPKAGFADHRVYFYQGEEIDRQVHLGADLASIAQSPVPAANHGRVVFAGSVGIYGNTVILDHGFGLMSTYSHLSEIHVQPGDTVRKDDVIGRTGATGLAAGDHLHFGVLVHDTFVNPVEWWDAGWVRDNIDLKIQQVESRVGS